MGTRRSVTNAKARHQLGGYWLWYRADRDDWCICSYKPGSRAVERKSTGIGGGNADDPPRAAQEALAARFQQNCRPAEPQKPGDVLVEFALARWLKEHASKTKRAAAYGYNVLALQRFFEHDENKGNLQAPPTVADVDEELVERLIEFRCGEGAAGATISGDLAALRGALNWAESKKFIERAPRIPYVPPELQSGPRELEYSVDEIATLLEAAARLPERRHVLLFILILLSTHGRVEAIYELDAAQIRNGLIYFNAPGRAQTKKRRSTVPIAPSLAPWLIDAKGKVIRYRVTKRREDWADPSVPEYLERECQSIRTAFEACLIEAGLREPALDSEGNQIMLPPRAKLGETEPRPMWRGRGSPNTLRHTIHTYLQRKGVPQAQIDAAAGHSSEKGSGKNYTHLRPEYLGDIVAAVEALWRELDAYTSVHRVTSPDPSRPKDDAEKPIAILDFRTSALGDGSYPIEVGVCVWPQRNGPIYSWSCLIRPADEWRQDGLWSEASAMLHVIPYDALDAGLPVEAVASALTRIAELFGDFVSDAVDADAAWSDRLCSAAGVPRKFTFAGFHEELTVKLDDAQFGRLMRNLQASPVPHRAAAAAERLIRALAHGLGVEVHASRSLNELCPELAEAINPFSQAA